MQMRDYQNDAGHCSRRTHILLGKGVGLYTHQVARETGIRRGRAIGRGRHVWEEKDKMGKTKRVTRGHMTQGEEPAGGVGYVRW